MSGRGNRAVSSALGIKTAWFGLVAAALAAGSLYTAPASPATVFGEGQAGEASALSPTSTTSATLGTVTRTGVLSSPFALAYDRRLPTISGVSSTMRSKFNAAVQYRVSQDTQYLKEWRAGCYADAVYQETATQVIRWYGSVYNSRYASVTLVSTSNPGCGGTDRSVPYSFTMDLTTGGLVSLGRFVSSNQGQLRAAVVWYLKAQNGSCIDAELHSTPQGEPFSLPSLSRWTVSSTGVTFWFPKNAVAYGYCGAVRARVPWSDILRPGQAGPTSVTSRMVSAYSIAVLTVTGQKAVLYLAGEGGEFCLRGVARSSRLIAYFMDGSDYRKVWDTAGTGTNRRLVGYKAPTTTQLSWFPKGSAEDRC